MDFLSYVGVAAIRAAGTPSASETNRISHAVYGNGPSDFNQ